MPIILLRHASAGKREDWPGDDEHRPLDDRGWEQADGIAGSLARKGLERILSSPATRCVQSVEPLAERVGLEVEECPELAEELGPSVPNRLVAELAGETVVLCTHGDVIEHVLGESLKKGAAWVLEPTDEGLVRIEYLPPLA